MCTADCSERIGILSLKHSGTDRNITTGVVITKTPLCSFCSPNSASNNAPNAMPIVSYAMICKISNSFESTAISLLTIQTMVHLGGVLKYYTVTGLFWPNNPFNIY